MEPSRKLFGDFSPRNPSAVGRASPRAERRACFNSARGDARPTRFVHIRADRYFLPSTRAWLALSFGLMALPDLIEIVPLDKPLRAEITVPGSKSITNRALILAALAEGEITLQNALWSEDTQVMAECLQDLGFMVNVAPAP